MKPRGLPARRAPASRADDQNGQTHVGGNRHGDSALCYLDTEKLHRVDGDGLERPVGDVNTVCTRGVNIFSIGAWGPDDPGKKEVVLWSGEPSAFKVLPDGTVKPIKAYAPQASLRLADVYPDEPEAMAVLSSYEFAVLPFRLQPGDRSESRA